MALLTVAAAAVHTAGETSVIETVFVPLDPARSTGMTVEFIKDAPAPRFPWVGETVVVGVAVWVVFVPPI
jgi:hypothetical protein